MLKATFKISMAVVLLTVGSVAGGHAKGHQHKVQETTPEVTHSEAIDKNTTLPILTDEDKAGIIYIIEEEKVAKDVYTHLAETWKQKIFSKISESEQKHVNAVSNLFSTYDVELPTTLDEEGIFTNETLQAMYDELIERGDQSLEEALKVGVEIEETDIEDLENLLDSELEDNVEKVYSRLLRGSYNHLRSFNRQLNK